MGDGLEMAGYLVATLEGDCVLTVELSWSKDCFNFIELYLGDGLEITGHPVVTLGRETLPVTVCSYHGLEMYVFVCNLTKYSQYRGHHYDCTRKWF